jgi:predicted amino acid racemase
MAILRLYREKLIKNYNFLESQFKSKSIEWSVVSKLLCGNELFLKELIALGPREICDSRISNLKAIKSLNKNIRTVYIKPPAKRSIPEIIEFADVSFNTEFATMEMLSEEAKKQEKVHKIIIMLEMGDLREGVMGDELIDFYQSVFQLPNLQISGIGTNLNCLNGVMPSEDKLIQLSLYKQLIEAKFDRKITWVTGGTSVVFPLLLSNRLPSGINHFRMGETLFFGNNLFTKEGIQGMEQKVFRLHAEIIEIRRKPIVPSGILDENPSGKVAEINEEDYGRRAHRAIVDIGLLDISLDHIQPIDERLQFEGASSDMIVLDISEAVNDYEVGGFIEFRVSYMGALALMNSNYIEKQVF